MRKPSVLYWILAVLFLLWNLIGCYFYWIDQTMSDAAYASTYGHALTALRDQYPVWATSAYAIAVWSGLIAAISMLLRKRWAVPLFSLSLISAVISFIWPVINAEFRAATGTEGFIMPVIVVLLGLLEVFYARAQKAKRILR